MIYLKTSLKPYSLNIVVPDMQYAAMKNDGEIVLAAVKWKGFLKKQPKN